TSRAGTWSTHDCRTAPTQLAAGGRGREAGTSGRGVRLDALCLLQAAEQVQEAELPYQPRGLDDDAPVHLRDAGAPIHEHDRDLLYPHPPPPGPERHPDLEPVPLRAYAVQPDALQRPAAETLEASGRVHDRHPRDDARVEVRGEGQDEPGQRPVDHGHAV